VSAAQQEQRVNQTSPIAIAVCDSGAALAKQVRAAPATVVAIRRPAASALFPADLEAALRALPYQVACVVAPPIAAAQAGVARVSLGEVLVFARTSLLARMPDAPESNADRLCALLRAGLSPWLGVPGAPSWDTDESDAYTITGRRLAASFAQVNEAWQRRLAESLSGRGPGRA
jgi:hypothetical protein